MSYFFNYTKVILETLSSEEIKVINRENPFRIERDKMIRVLVGRGVRQKELAEISGLSRSTISRIVRDTESRRYQPRGKA